MSTAALLLAGRSCRSPRDRDKHLKNSKDRCKVVESEFSSVIHAFQIFQQLIFHIRTLLRDTSTGLGAAARKDSCLRQYLRTLRYSRVHLLSLLVSSCSLSSKEEFWLMMCHILSVSGWLRCVHRVLYMSCRVRFYLRTALENSVSCSHHQQVYITL